MSSEEEEQEQEITTKTAKELYDEMIKAARISGDFPPQFQNTCIRCKKGLAVGIMAFCDFCMVEMQRNPRDVV